MKLQHENFPLYMNVPMHLIPADELTPLLMELAANAMFYMNTENDAKSTPTIISAIKDMILTNPTYRHMKLHLIVETFHHGSLGELGGTTKFGIRNVNVWLAAVKEKHQKLIADDKSREDNQRKAEEERAFRQSQKRSNKYASALFWKVSHCPMPDAQYDRLTLDKIVEAYEKGYKWSELKPEMIL